MASRFLDELRWLPSFPPLLWSPNLDQSTSIFQECFSLSWGFPPATAPCHFPSLGAQREGRGLPPPRGCEAAVSRNSSQASQMAKAETSHWPLHWGAPPHPTVSQLETQIYLQGEVRKIVNRLATEQLRLPCVLILLIT